MNTDRMTDIVEFLRARLDEDEATARAESDLVARLIDPSEFTLAYGWARFTEHTSGGSGVGYAPGAPTPTRVLAEVEAKRRILDRYEANLDRQTDPEESQLSADIIVGEYEDWTLPALALPYADHPDYDPAWRP